MVDDGQAVKYLSVAELGYDEVEVIGVQLPISDPTLTLMTLRPITTNFPSFPQFCVTKHFPCSL